MYNTKESFEKMSADSVSDWKANIKNIRQHLIKIFIKKLRSFYIFYVNMFYLVLLLDIDMLEG